MEKLLEFSVLTLSDLYKIVVGFFVWSLFRKVVNITFESGRDGVLLGKRCSRVG
jgi:hypothetical protein